MAIVPYISVIHYTLHRVSRWTEMPKHWKFTIIGADDLDKGGERLLGSDGRKCTALNGSELRSRSSEPSNKAVEKCPCTALGRKKETNWVWCVRQIDRTGGGKTVKTRRGHKGTEKEKDKKQDSLGPESNRRHFGYKLTITAERDNQLHHQGGLVLKSRGGP